MLLDTMVTCALLGDIGGGELLVVFGAILLLFGGKRLPSIARQIGRTVDDLRKASQDFKNQLMHADEDDDTLPGPEVTHTAVSPATDRPDGVGPAAQDTQAHAPAIEKKPGSSRTHDLSG